MRVALAAAPRTEADLAGTPGPSVILLPRR